MDHDRVGNAAVAHSARVVEAACVRAGHAVEILDVLGQNIASLAVGRGDAAHDDAGGILHDHHIAGIARALDRLDDDAVVILVGMEDAADVGPAGAVFRHSVLGADRDERGIRRRIVLGLLDFLDLGDLLGRVIQGGKPLERARLARHDHKLVAHDLPGSLEGHVADAVQAADQQQDRLKKDDHGAADKQHRRAALFLLLAADPISAAFSFPFAQAHSPSPLRIAK